MPLDDLVTVHGEPSFILANKVVKATLTRRAGHLAPVRFRLGQRWVEPFALAPWKPQDLAEGDPVIRVLRGDYFCLPFGSSLGISNVHGDTANAEWKLASADPGRLVLDMQVRRPACRVTKTIGIRAGQRAIYQEHVIEGLQGRFNFGHHAILRFPETGGPYHVNVSPFRFGRVKPELFSNPAAREYGALKTGARFTSLAKVALATGGTTSLHAYPARPGFDDLVMLSSRTGDFAWTAATLDGYVWIALKDPRVLPSTLFWISNGGRHAPPWNGIHRGRLGLEEVCSHYSDGPEVARQDRLRSFGIPTSFAFRRKAPKIVRVIHLVHPIPKNFGGVRSIRRDSDGSAIEITGLNGHHLLAPVDWNFLYR